VPKLFLWQGWWPMEDRETASLTLWGVAEKWASENPTVGVDTLAAELVQRALASDIEVSDLEGRADAAFDLAFDWFVDGGKANLTASELDHYARNMIVTFSELSDFCERLSFKDWSETLGVRTPGLLNRWRAANPPKKMNSRGRKAGFWRREAARFIARAVKNKGEEYLDQPIGNIGNDVTRHIRRPETPARIKSSLPKHRQSIEAGCKKMIEDLRIELQKVR